MPKTTDPNLNPSFTTRQEPRTVDQPKSRHCVTIGVKPEEAFKFWRDFKNLPLFMKDLTRIEVRGKKLSHWVVELKSGRRAEWDAEITAETDGKMIAWKSLEGSEVETRGTVWFEKAPRDLGTIVRLEMDYKIPGGKLAEVVTMFTGEDPDTLAITNLKRFKAVLETGEYPTVEGQPSGRDELPAAQH